MTRTRDTACLTGPDKEHGLQGSTDVVDPRNLVFLPQEKACGTFPNQGTMGPAAVYVKSSNVIPYTLTSQHGL